MAKELIAKTFTFRCARNEAGNIDECYACRNNFIGFV
jgi:hypothetical protein